MDYFFCCGSCILHNAKKIADGCGCCYLLFFFTCIIILLSDIGTFLSLYLSVTTAGVVMERTTSSCKVKQIYLAGIIRQRFGFSAFSSMQIFLPRLGFDLINLTGQKLFKRTRCLVVLW